MLYWTFYMFSRDHEQNVLHRWDANLMKKVVGTYLFNVYETLLK